MTSARFLCNECGKFFTAKKNLNRHVGVHRKMCQTIYKRRQFEIVKSVLDIIVNDLFVKTLVNKFKCNECKEQT